jgi:hypothetical protein
MVDLCEEKRGAPHELKMEPVKCLGDEKSANEFRIFFGDHESTISRNLEPDCDVVVKIWGFKSRGPRFEDGQCPYPSP